MLFDPFKPREIKLSNYHPDQIEQNKLKNTMEKTQLANGRMHEFQKGYEPKSYADAVQRPKSFGDAFKKPDSYSDAFKTAQNINDRNMELEKIKNENKTTINFNGFKNN